MVRIILVLIVIILSSCEGVEQSDNNRKVIVRKEINDSLSVRFFFNKENKNIHSLIFKNKNSNVNRVIGFRDDGFTVSSITSYKNRKEVGLSYRYFPNGVLNFKSNFKDGEFHGDCETYSNEGILLYKATYLNGIEKEVIIGTREEEIEIIEE